MTWSVCVGVCAASRKSLNLRCQADIPRGGEWLPMSLAFGCRMRRAREACSGMRSVKRTRTAHDHLVDRVHSQFEQDLSRLFDLLKIDKASSAADVVGMLFNHLDALDQSLPSYASGGVREAEKY